MKYYRFETDTPYCGTRLVEYRCFEDDVTTRELEDYGEGICYDNAETYEYLVFGWDCDPVVEGEMTEQERDDTIENYYADCEYNFTEITKEEYEENT